MVTAYTYSEIILAQKDLQASAHSVSGSCKGSNGPVFLPGFSIYQKNNPSARAPHAGLADFSVAVALQLSSSHTSIPSLAHMHSSK